MTRSHRSSQKIAIALTLLYLTVTVVSVFVTRLPTLIPATHVIMSIITFIFYAHDKSAAEKNTWRTSESSLHMLALLGGWPGALVAQQTLRHKTKKTSFRFVFWITVLVNLCFIAWLHTDDGRALIEPVVSAIRNITENYTLGWPEF